MGEPTPLPDDVLAALDSIEFGQWDRYLFRVQAMIRRRLDTEEYNEHLIAGVMETWNGNKG